MIATDIPKGDTKLLLVKLNVGTDSSRSCRISALVLYTSSEHAEGINASCAVTKLERRAGTRGAPEPSWNERSGSLHVASRCLDPDSDVKTHGRSGTQE